MPHHAHCNFSCIIQIVALNCLPRDINISCMATIQAPQPEIFPELIVLDDMPIEITYYNRTQESFYVHSVVICNGDLSVDESNDEDPKLSVRAHLLAPYVQFSILFCPSS
jgi:hypothetical protein